MIRDINVQTLLQDFGDLDKNYSDMDIQIYIDNLEALDKSFKPSQKRHVYGEASNEHLDLEGDTVDASGVGQSMDFWKAHGKVDWCHKGGAMPNFLVGEPVDWMQHNGRLMIEGSLYDNWPMADQVHGILMRKGRLGYSLGGKILSTCMKFDKDFGGMVKRVQKVFVNHVAVTPYPVNYNTNVTLVPWNQFLGMLDKDITGKNAGAGDAEFKKAMNTMSGQALLTESLEHSGNKEIINALVNLIGGMKGGGVIPTTYLGKSGHFRTPRHAHDYLMKHYGLSADKADVLVDYLILRHDEICSIL